MAFMILSTLNTNAAFRPCKKVVRRDAGASLRRSGGSAEGEENMAELSAVVCARRAILHVRAAQFFVGVSGPAQLELSAPRVCRCAASRMPTTRAAWAAARAAERQLILLPTDVLSLILYQLPLAHDIALAGLTCRALCDAAKLAFKARPFYSEVVTLAGHTRFLTWAMPTPDGRIITSSDRTVKVWRDGACERTIQPQPGWAMAVAVSVSLDGALPPMPNEDGNVSCVAAMPDGVHFVAGLCNGDSEGEVRLYHVDGTLVHTFKGHTDNVTAVAVTPDGQHIISGSRDNLVNVWNVASKSLLSTCTGHTDIVGAVAAMPDGQRFLSGVGGDSNDNAIRVWLLNGTLKKILPELHSDAVVALMPLPDNQHVLSGSFDNTVKLFNVNDGAVLRTFKQKNFVHRLTLLPDGLRFVSGTVSGTDTARISYHGLAPQ